MFPKFSVARVLSVALGAAFAVPIPLAAQTTEAPKSTDAKAKDGVGEAAYNNACRTCHSTKPGDNRLGPSLGGIVGRKAGAESGFAYSEAMKNSGVTWDAATIDKFITNPDSVVPGSNMKPFTGISDAAVRKQIVDFLGAK